MSARKTKFIRRKIAAIRWAVGLAVSLLLYWWVMSNYVIQDFWDPQYVMKFEALQARVAENPGHPLWLIMGSSRVERGLDAGLLAARPGDINSPLIYNFGLGGADIFREYICLRRLLEAGIKPQRVGIEVVGAGLADPAIQTKNSPQLLVRARVSELGDYSAFSDDPSAFLREWRHSRWDPTYKYGMKMPHQTLSWRLIPLPGIRRLEWVPYDKWGWSPQPPGPTPEASYRADFELEKMGIGDKLEHFNILPGNDLALRRILEMCRSAGIKVFLLKTPEGKDFRALYSPAASAMIDSYIAKIQGEYGVPLIDATTWVGREGFTDGHHMNGTGAVEFTRRFGEELSALKL
jgi:hypothetical protein